MDERKELGLSKQLYKVWKEFEKWPTHLFTHKDIYELVMGNTFSDGFVHAETSRPIMKRLRKRLPDKNFITVRGTGYYYVPSLQSETE